MTYAQRQLRLRLRLPLLLLLLLLFGSPSVYRRDGDARSGKRCGVCLSATQRSEFSRAPLRASTAREPRAAGRDHRVAFFAPLFWRRKKEGRLPGRTPGLVMMQGHARWVTRRKGVTAKQQLPLKFEVSLRTSKATPTVLPVPCWVTQGGCTAVEASRVFAPAGDLLLLLHQKK